MKKIIKKYRLEVKLLRPRYLELEGLQSFKELQTIDFDKLSETGLFGIFGPTGSGKSTILDALTLALYGNVQRANRGTQGIMNTSASIMRVSFTFDLIRTNERKTYKVERVYRRKKDSENSIESRVARLFEIGRFGETVIADKQGEVNDAVTELIGLQFDDFTRSVVLPQNKFQEFLLSPKAEKTKMLERIFYLEEYGRELTDKVNRKLGLIRNKLSGTLGALSVLGDISETSLRDAEAAFYAAAEHKRSVDDALKASETEYNGAKEVWELSSELYETVRKQEELKGLEAGMDSMRNRCKNAREAQSFAERISDIKKTDAELKKTSEELDKLSTVLYELEALLKNSKRKLEAAGVLRQERIPVLVEYKTKLIKALETKNELKKMEEVLQKLRNEYIVLKNKVDQSDVVIKEQKSRLNESLAKSEEKKARIDSLKVETGYRDKLQKGAALEEELERSMKVKEQQKSRYEEFLSIIQRQEKELEALEQSGIRLCDEVRLATASYEKHKESKQWDRNDIIKAETRYYSIRSITDELKSSCKAIEQLELKISEYDKESVVLEQKLNELNVKKQDKLSELDKKKLLLEEKKKEQEKDIAFSLAQRLKDNEPCPVCGAIAHPNPATNLEGRIHGTGEAEIKELQALIDKLDMQCRALESEEIKFSLQHNNLKKQKEALLEDRRNKQEEQTELFGKLPEEYRGLSVPLIEAALKKLSEEKQERLKAIENWENKLSELEKMQKEKSEEYNRYRVEISGKRSQLEANKQHLDEMQKSCIEAEEDCNTKKKAYDNAVADLGVENIRFELRKMQSNDREAERLYKELETLEKASGELRKEIEKAEEAKKLDMEKLSENIAEGRGFKYRKDEMEKELKALLGDNDIKAELAKTEEEMAVLVKEEQKAQQYVNTVRDKYEKSIKDKKVFEKQREIYEEKLRLDTKRLEKELADKGFASIAEVEAAIMQKESLEEQERIIKEYEERCNNTKAQKVMIEKKLSGRSITEELWQEISRRYEELKLEKENSIAAYESAKSRFETIKSNYSNWLSLVKEMQEYSKKKEHLELIKNLLKGNGFIEYISEERLRYIAKEASETLGVLTRHRYGLELDIENGFVIRDDANGGIRRLVTTLSGGETFLTSLALALALSSQIQLKGQSPLEFFFLDEGFGTLDENLLDTVVDALERLSTEKRVIGIISHVPELKSRITRRLVVEAPVINGTGSRVHIEKA